MIFVVPIMMWAMRVKYRSFHPLTRETTFTRIFDKVVLVSFVLLAVWLIAFWLFPADFQ
jgi:hypothetical protein